VSESVEGVPRAPAGTRDAGRRLWDWAVGEFVFDPHELALLTQAVRIVDRLDELAAVVARDGVMVPTVAGEKPNPALVESRQQSIALARVLAALRMPSGDEDASRPQRRVGVRGIYGTGGGPARLRRVS
jgi:hypothetical protein